MPESIEKKRLAGSENPTDRSPRCNLCGSNTFVEMGGRPAARCAECGSLERTRLMYLFIRDLVRSPRTRTLHLAPERGLYTRLSKMLLDEFYTVADRFPDKFPFAKDVAEIDLCSLDTQPTNHYDLIIHSHVLEPVSYTHLTLPTIYSV